MTASAPTRTLLVGTNNAHKAGEIAALLAPLGIAVTTPRDLGIADEPVEDGATFAENALIKARFYAERAEMPALADDSGLVVDALDGRPGIYSSRYAPTDSERIARLLGELRAVPDERRSARFVCAAALVVPKVGQASCLSASASGTSPIALIHASGTAASDTWQSQPATAPPTPGTVTGLPSGTGRMPVLLSNEEWVREGRCEGRIAHVPRGVQGFGYDPVFLVADLGFVKSMAELTPDEKNRLSHRARALAAMLELLAANG
jgi:XTP/dITP diphosphohydrolase